ncbi:MAG: hypothetical protein GC203_22320 [Phenylobacterium sp.]|uniref:hypothetical protein n=1 Tax=Phenylobacterium sp. TaxID=1871053 RepID=UPI0025F304DA|nr:hypothetical protein [Phenylobacterium sp.]MBI1200607.1 hypothetical protein [Phenylobacterium sp.]
MGEADDTRPLWRTPLGAALAAWMAVSAGALVAGWRIAETAPAGVLPGLAVGLGLIAPVGLLIWSLWAMLRDPVTGWMAPAALLFFLGAMVPAWRPLADAGMRMNFEAHVETYDAIVADAKAGLMRPDAHGWVRGSRDGVRFRYRADRPGEVEFSWVRDGLLDAGVRYNEIPCTPTPQLKCLDRGERIEGRYFHYAQIP